MSSAATVDLEKLYSRILRIMPTASSRDKAKEIFHSFNIGTKKEYNLHSLLTPEFLHDWKSTLSKKYVGLRDEDDPDPDPDCLAYSTFHTLWLDYDYNPDLLGSRGLDKAVVLNLWEKLCNPSYHPIRLDDDDDDDYE